MLGKGRAKSKGGRRLTRSLRWPLIAQSLLIIVMTGCRTPEEPRNYTVSGQVYDSITGAGIANATVVVGTQTVTTDANGSYSLTFDSSEAVTGMLGAWKGLEYSFFLVDKSFYLRHIAGYA